jgi:hypothetical protein
LEPAVVAVGFLLGRERVIVSPISSSEPETRALERGLGFDEDDDDEVVEVEGKGVVRGFVALFFCVVPVEERAASREELSEIFRFLTWAEGVEVAGLCTGVSGPQLVLKRDAPGTGLGKPLRPPGIGVRLPRPFSALALASSRKWR